MKSLFSSLFCLFGIISLNAQSIELDKKNPRFDSIINPIKYYKGKEMPSFTHTAFSGKEYTSEMLKGKVTFINFWFYNCAPCMAEMKSLNTLYEKYKDNPDFQFISFTHEDRLTIRRVVKKYGIQYDIISVPRDECRRLNFGKGYPTNFIYNQKGEIIFMQVGGSTNTEMVEKRFQFSVIPLVAELLLTK